MSLGRCTGASTGSPAPRLATDRRTVSSPPGQRHPHHSKGLTPERLSNVVSRCRGGEDVGF
jgi:hypothetical protein